MRITEESRDELGAQLEAKVRSMAVKGRSREEISNYIERYANALLEVSGEEKPYDF